MYFLDTNILLRFLLDDVKEHSVFTQELFHNANENKFKLFIVPEVLVEVRYVLSSFYNFEKKEIVTAINQIIDLSFIEILTNYKLDFGKAIDFHVNKKLSLEDCLYLQICLENNLKLLTFDLKLKKEWEKFCEI